MELDSHVFAVLVNDNQLVDLEVLIVPPVGQPVEPAVVGLVVDRSSGGGKVLVDNDDLLKGQFVVCQVVTANIFNDTKKACW